MGISTLRPVVVSALVDSKRESIRGIFAINLKGNPEKKEISSHISVTLKKACLNCVCFSVLHVLSSIIPNAEEIIPQRIKAKAFPKFSLKTIAPIAPIKKRKKDSFRTLPVSRRITLVSSFR